MDLITQAALGGLCGELTLRKQLGRKGLTWGCLFGILPDLDILAYPWLDAAQRLSWHRGLSHSIIIMIFAALLFGWLLAKLHKSKGVMQKQATWFVFITWLTHVLIDAFTSYGTQVFEPFSSYRVAFNNISIIDISFTIPMLFGLLAVMFFDKESKIREWIGGVTALWLCFYVIASLIIKHQAKIYFEEQLLVNGINPTRTMTAPTISNIFLWRMVAETNEHYHIGYWSLFDDSDRPLKLETLAKGHDYLEKFDQFQETNTLKWFANNWHMIVPENKNSNTVLFIDLRFTEMVTADKKYPIFVWRLKTDANDLQHLDFSPVSYRDQAPPKETVQYLWQRIIGSAPHWMDATWPWQSQPLKQ